MKHRIATFCLAMLVGCTAIAGELVITSKDIPFEVGYKVHYAVATADPDGPTEIDFITIGKRTVGPRTLFRMALPMGEIRLADQWIAIGDAELAVYNSFDDRLPAFKYPLPLKKGLNFEYEAVLGKVRAKVEGPVTVDTPAGKFECLLIVEERENGAKRWQQKLWLAPGVGHVKHIFRMGQDMTSTLVSVRKPTQAKPVPGTQVVSTFDKGELMGSPLFPRARWAAGTGNLDSSSIADIDPVEGAVGTPFCLRWTYHARGTWVNVGFTPSGVWGVPLDLSPYTGLSFHIKGLTPERGIGVTFIATGPGGKGMRFYHVPVRVGIEWREVMIDLKARPELAEVDWKTVHTITIGTSTEGEVSGVISIDEIMLHSPNQF
jgi:hypothetical protein